MYHYYGNCVNWPEENVCSPGGLNDLVENRTIINKDKFLKNLHSNWIPSFRQELEDTKTEFFESTLYGDNIIGFENSGIEYIFTK